MSQRHVVPRHVVPPSGVSVSTQGSVLICCHTPVWLLDSPDDFIAYPKLKSPILEVYLQKAVPGDFYYRVTVNLNIVGRSSQAAVRSDLTPLEHNWLVNLLRQRGRRAA